MKVRAEHLQHTRVVNRQVRRRNYLTPNDSLPHRQKLFYSPLPVPAATKNVRERKIGSRALETLASLVFLAGVFISFQTVTTNRHVQTQVNALAAKSTVAAHEISDGSVPAVNRPSIGDIKNYVVSPDLPRLIQITKLGASGRVVPLNSNSSGKLNAPGNIFDAGWYTGSSKPGEKGAALIDGHVSSWSTHGIFYGLNKLQKGDVVSVTRGDGELMTFTVVGLKITNADQVDMVAALKPVNPSKPGLNLISCTGKVKPGTSEFEDRVVVFTELTTLKNQ